MKEKKAVVIVRDLVNMCIEKQISRSAAELSYFLTLSIFPTLICLYAMLGNFFPEAEALLGLAKGFAPSETIEAISDYLNYVSSHNNSAMLMAGLLLMASSSAAAFRSLHNIMGEIQGKTRYTGFFAVVFSFLFSLIFLAVIYFAVVVMVTGRWFLNFASKYITFISISDAW
ncbi:MAG TPA: YihY/virulence factor BrkB family protein, partial [Clostridiales bacterium]|nr:YihY/virulence factor BrkB family protein [Clostridiales bacterium]